MKHVEQMIQLGYISGKNATSWSFKDSGGAMRANAQDQFRMHLGHALRPPGNFKEEAIRTAEEISDSAKGHAVTVLASGGLDSEVVLKSFLLAKRPFEVVAFDLSSTNGDELFHLDHFCRNHQIKYKKIHIDVEQFWENDLESFALTSGSTSPQINTLLFGLSKIEGHVVLGDGELSIRKKGKEFFEIWRERHSFARWMLSQNRPGCPSFFSYSPELELSMYADSIVEDFTKYGWYMLDCYHFDYCKPFLYYHHFGTRLRGKVDIFKPLRDLEQQSRNYLQKLLPGADGEVQMSYSQVLAHLRREDTSANTTHEEIENGSRLVIG